MDEDLDAKIQFKQDNPKSLGTESHRRYRNYCRATSVREALYWGATRGDLKRDEAAGFLIRGPKLRATKQGKKGRVMEGIVRDSGNYICERDFRFFAIQARRQKSIAQALVTLKAIDRVEAAVHSRINEKVMAGKRSTLEDFVAYVKAAVADEQKASPDLGVEKWRYFSRNKLNQFTAESLQELRKDPHISFGIQEIRALQDSMENGLRGWLTLAKAAGLSEVSEIKGVAGINARRRAADDLAREELAGLKKGSWISDDAVLKVLRLWGFDKSKSRQNVMPEGTKWVHSDTLGIIEDRADHIMCISSPCKGHENFVRFLSAWARKRSPNGELPFTTISLNKNYAGRLHRDGGNIGPSVGLAIGRFTGGRLRFWAGDSKKGTRTDPEQVRSEPSVALNTRGGVVFDGNCAHEVEPFEGERYSLIFFTLKKYKKTSHEVKRKMVNMGADWPTDASLKRLQAKVPRQSGKRVRREE